jgi:hypothetical protein
MPSCDTWCGAEAVGRWLIDGLEQDLCTYHIQQIAELGPVELVTRYDPGSWVWMLPIVSGLST